MTIPNSSPAMPRRSSRTRVGLLLALALSLAPAVGHAGRPLDTEDTGTGEPRGVEIEASGNVVRIAKENLWSVKGALNVGIVEGFLVKVESELLVLDPDHGPSETGISDTVIGAKYRFLDDDEAGWRPAVLAALSLRLPSGDAGRSLGDPGVDVRPLVAVSKDLGPVTLTANVGYTFVTKDRDSDAWWLALAAEYRPVERWTLGAELTAEVPEITRIPDRRGESVVVKGGAAWEFAKDWKLDAGVGVGLTKDSPDVTATLGITYAFRW